MNPLINSELKVSDNIQIVGHYDDETLLTKSSDLIKTIKFDGFDFYTKSDDEIQTQINKLTESPRIYRRQLVLHYAA